jgi:hypothetical protein
MNISDRTTISKKIPEIDSLYVYKTRHKAKFTHRKQEGEGYRYTLKKAILRASEGEIHIYHRAAEINGVMRGLTMVTKNDKFREVQKWFTEQIKEIKVDEKLTAKFMGAKYSPMELGIYYLY